jgi:hypothetical protein
MVIAVTGGAWDFTLYFGLGLAKAGEISAPDDVIGWRMLIKRCVCVARSLQCESMCLAEMRSSSVYIC